MIDILRVTMRSPVNRSVCRVLDKSVILSHLNVPSPPVNMNMNMNMNCKMVNLLGKDG